MMVLSALRRLFLVQHNVIKFSARGQSLKRRVWPQGSELAWKDGRDVDRLGVIIWLYSDRKMASVGCLRRGTVSCERARRVDCSSRLMFLEISIKVFDRDQASEAHRLDEVEGETWQLATR